MGWPPCVADRHTSPADANPKLSNSARNIPIKFGNPVRLAMRNMLLYAIGTEHPIANGDRHACKMSAPYQITT